MPQKSINLQLSSQLTSRFTISVVSNSIYNVDPKTFEGGESEILKRAYEYMTPSTRGIIISQLFKFYPCLQKVIKISLFKPGLDQFFIDLMESSMQQRIASDVKNSDFLEYLIGLKNKKEIDGEFESLVMSVFSSNFDIF
jgi:hypothetical protein